MTPGQATRQPGVLPTSTDRERERLVRHDHDRDRVTFFVFLEHDVRDVFHRAERVRDKPLRVGAPLDNVDALAVELLHHHLNAAAPHPNARPDRVDAILGGRDGDLRPLAGLAGHGLNLNQLVGDLGYFLLEQSYQEHRLGSRQNHRGLRPPADPLLVVGIDDVDDERAHAVAATIPLVTQLLLQGQNRLGPLDFHDDVSVVFLLDDSRHDLFDPIRIETEDVRALRVLDLLHKDLASQLGLDASEVLGANRHLHEFTYSRFWMHLVRFFDGYLGSVRTHDFDNALRRRDLDLARLLV